MANLFEHGNELSGSIKPGNFLTRRSLSLTHNSEWPVTLFWSPGASSNTQLSLSSRHKQT